ncbi:Phage major tail protein 2 [Pseudovibrio sp. Ad13]|uniref:phage major tail protein, TP901-1 family n=1 Tax=Pseudovibrio sp. Ad13 TaxID=989396 RepID=UPI0007AE4A34|nr:phage major tail protein, TP901-1 family [Pseudovibrio sp. Ad13]KZK83497.1 Phage major tail protein 2 [Pseudovibrio sp. Ad13]
MVAQAGKDLLLKLDTVGDGTFESVAGLRSRRLALNATPIDITDAESTGRWRELLAGASTRQASLSGSGLFRDKASAEKVRMAFFAGELRSWQVILPGFGTLEGPFHLSALEYSGDYRSEVTFEISLESAGALTFTPLT